MIYLVFWVLAAYGISSIIIWGSIFESARVWIRSQSKFFGELIGCMLCTSTWVGFFMSIVLGGLASEMFDVNKLVGLFFDGVFTAGAVWAINSIVEYYEENRINNK